MLLHFIDPSTPQNTCLFFLSAIGAAAVAERYVGDATLAVRHLLTATQWEAAVQLIHQHNLSPEVRFFFFSSSPQVPTLLQMLAAAQTAVTEAADAQLASLASQNAEFLRLCNRFVVILIPSPYLLLSSHTHTPNLTLD